MKFVTDRTEADVLQGRIKGFYSYEDLNRVEGKVRALCELAAQTGIVLDLKTKTDWSLPGDFNPEAWPTEANMGRYLQNVKDLCAALDIRPELPSTMKHLTVTGANNIEKALENAYEEIRRRMS